MNERIKLLAEQAGIYKLNLSDETEYWIMEKFAELIVQECMQVSLKHSHRDDDMGAIIARNIKQHFGVEP